jgi:hypothetical protein
MGRIWVWLCKMSTAGVWDFSISRRWTKVYRTHMIQQSASVASDHIPIMSELTDIIIGPTGHCFLSGNILVLAFFEHVLLIGLLVTLKMS